MLRKLAENPSFLALAFLVHSIPSPSAPPPPPTETSWKKNSGSCSINSESGPWLRWLGECHFSLGSDSDGLTLSRWPLPAAIVKQAHDTDDLELLETIPLAVDECKDSGFIKSVRPCSSALNICWDIPVPASRPLARCLRREANLCQTCHNFWRSLCVRSNWTCRHSWFQQLAVINLASPWQVVFVLTLWTGRKRENI